MKKFKPVMLSPSIHSAIVLWQMGNKSSKPRPGGIVSVCILMTPVTGESRHTDWDSAQGHGGGSGQPGNPAHLGGVLGSQQLPLFGCDFSVRPKFWNNLHILWELRIIWVMFSLSWHPQHQVQDPVAIKSSIKLKCSQHYAIPLINHCW